MSARSCHLVALHGFLGHASDWDPLRERFADAVLTAVDLWRLFERVDGDGWPPLVLALDRRIREAIDSVPDAPAFLLGYSFGGRLAMGLDGLAEGRLPVQGTCLVSCHPGLADADMSGRTARRLADDRWAALVEEADETVVLREWEAQPVLARRGGPAMRREHLPASRAVLARAMRRCSLAGQPDRRARLRQWRAPLLWVTGAADEKYCALSDSLAQDGVPAQFVRCAHAGHRVPWDAMDAFSAVVRTWIDRVIGVAGSGAASPRGVHVDER